MRKTRILKLVTTLLTICMLLTSYTSVSASGQMQSMTSGNLKGVDVSHWDGKVDWIQVKKAGISFAYAKASDGPNSLDDTFAYNVKAARSAKVPIGAYHFARPAVPFAINDSIQQAKFFVSSMKHNGMADYGDIMPVLDLELPSEPGSLTPDQLTQWAQTFVATVRSLTQRQVMIYTGAWFVQQNHDFGDKLKDLPVWIASWTRYGAAQPPAVGGWTTWTAWQYSDKGTVLGINDQVDLDVGPTSLQGLRGFLSTPPATTTQVATSSKAGSGTSGSTHFYVGK